MKLLLFDIDGTLLNANGVGRRAIHAALAELTGCEITSEGIAFSGKTDPQILREVLTLSAVDPVWLDGRFPECLDIFERSAGELMESATVDALPGVRPLVEELADSEDVQLALLTGNLRTMAYRKVGAIGLAHYFPFGAFGCDAEDRNQLPAVAASRAREHVGREFAGTDVVVIGDTPRDIDCARAFGATAIAVATGRFSGEELEAHRPDVLLESLEDGREFARAAGI